MIIQESYGFGRQGSLNQKGRHRYQSLFPQHTSSNSPVRSEVVVTSDHAAALASRKLMRTIGVIHEIENVLTYISIIKQKILQMQLIQKENLELKKESPIENVKDIKKEAQLEIRQSGFCWEDIQQKIKIKAQLWYQETIRKNALQ